MAMVQSIRKTKVEILINEEDFMWDSIQNRLQDENIQAILLSIFCGSIIGLDEKLSHVAFIGNTCHDGSSQSDFVHIFQFSTESDASCYGTDLYIKIF